MATDDENLDLDTIFTEPARPPTPEPTFAKYYREKKNVDDDSDWTEINIRLVGSHPLWGHYLWNAALAMASYLDSNQQIYSKRNVLELGAGGALPSIITANNGASKVVITDYPDATLMDNMRYNVSQNVKKEQLPHVDVQGYIWGHPIEHLLNFLSPSSPRQKFDLIILSDLVFNHSQHDALIKTCDNALNVGSGPGGMVPRVLVFYTHHRPHLATRDMVFFEKAQAAGWKAEEVLTQTFPPMFPEDSGEESIRSTVHGWQLTRER